MRLIALSIRGRRNPEGLCDDLADLLAREPEHAGERLRSPVPDGTLEQEAADD